MYSLSKRLAILDALRFIAALSVLFFHYAWRAAFVGEVGTQLHPIIGVVAKYGYLGVHLFFMISGFVILMSSVSKDLRKYVTSRITRLFPGYWTGVTLTSIVFLLAENGVNNVSLPQYLANLTMMQVFLGYSHIDGVYWSLMVELLFYFYIGILIFVRQISQIERYLWIWLAAILVAPLVHVSSILAYMLNVRWGALFVAGCTYYLIYHDGCNLRRCLLICISYLTVILYGIEEMHHMEDIYNTSFSAAVIVSSLTCFFIIFTLIASRRLVLPEHSIIIAMGAITYPLYLIHQKIGYLLLNNYSELYEDHILIFGVALFMIIISYFVYRIIVYPFMKYIKNMINKILYKIAEINTVFNF